MYYTSTRRSSKRIVMRQTVVQRVIFLFVSPRPRRCCRFDCGKKSYCFHFDSQIIVYAIRTRCTRSMSVFKQRSQIVFRFGGADRLFCTIKLRGKKSNVHARRLKTSPASFPPPHTPPCPIQIANTIHGNRDHLNSENNWFSTKLEFILFFLYCLKRQERANEHINVKLLEIFKFLFVLTHFIFIAIPLFTNQFKLFDYAFFSLKNPLFCHRLCENDFLRFYVVYAA